MEIFGLNFKSIRGATLALRIVPFSLTVAAALPSNAFSTTFTVVHQFSTTQGCDGIESLYLGTEGKFYGATPGRYLSGYIGGAFSISRDGEFVNLGPLNSADGVEYSGLVEGADGALWGMALGRAPGAGSIYRVTKSGVRTAEYAFPGGSLDDANQHALTVDPSGRLFGTSSSSRSEVAPGIFMFEPSKGIRYLHRFTAAEGRDPNSIMFASNGLMYGLNSVGGNPSEPADNAGGTVYRRNANGTVSVLYAFKNNFNVPERGADGGQPVGRLVEAADGMLYGVTTRGGRWGKGTIFRIGKKGEKYRQLHSFGGASPTAPQSPQSGLTLHPNGNLYGVTWLGGNSARGTAYEVSLTGKVSVIHHFDNAATYYPLAGLTVAPDGSLWGLSAGDFSCGAIYSLTP